MDYLDAKALFILSALFSVLMSVVLFAIARGASNLLDGMYSFACAYLAYSCFVLLLLSRPVVPPLFSVVLADLALSLAVLLVYDGMRRLHGFSNHYHWYGIYLLACLIGYSLFTFLWPSFYGRVMVVAVSMALMFGLCLYLLWKKGLRQWRLGEWLLTISLLASVAAVVLRGWHGVLQRLVPLENSIFAYQGTQAVYLTINILAVVFIALALIILSQDRLRQDLERIASHDGLTGVQTRRLILEMLEKSLAGVARGGQPLALMLIDLDHFKDINDSYGHQAGDAVLVRVVHAIEAALRRESFIGRYGGEEFLVVMPDTDEQQLQEVSERIRRVAAQTAVSYGQHILHCTVSVGGLKLDSGNLALIKDPLTCVDAALYEAKAQGRNRVVLYGCSQADPGVDEALGRR